MAKFSESDYAFLKESAQFFETPRKMEKGLKLFSTPIESLHKKLPENVRKTLSRISKSAIEHALTLSIKTVSKSPLEANLAQAQMKSKLLGGVHTGASAVLGGVGGFFGALALPVELPLATVVILRSIVEIARQSGADINSPEVKMECLYILSMGGPSGTNTLQSEYYTSRLAFAEILKNASSFIAINTTREILLALENHSAPALLRLVAEVATRFQFQLTRKLVAQMTPFIGAVGGAGMNVVFTHYYNSCARYHFGLKKLEKEYGVEKTRKAFEKLRLELKAE